MQLIKNYFGISEKGFKNEVIGGTVTFISMAYILFVNPQILEMAGMDAGGVFISGALIAGIATIAMGVFAKTPIALAPGMGLNAFFVFNVSIGMGLGWEKALATVFVSGIIFFILSATKIRSYLLNSIPKSIKYSIGAGIGLFIAYIGLQNAGIIVSNPATITGIGDLSHPAVLLAVFGIILVFVLHVAKVYGAIFFAMIATLIVGLIMGNVLNQDFGLPSLTSDANFSNAFGAFGNQFGKVFSNLLGVITSKEGWIAIVIFVFIDFFDTVGTVVAVGQQTGDVDSEGQLENDGKILMVDSSATVVGAIFGTSTVTAYVESTAGVQAGARTGFASVVTGILFLLAIFMYPLLSAITNHVTALALVLVGSSMLYQLKKIDWEDDATKITAFLIMITMTLSFAIHWGIVIGLVIWPLLKLAQRKREEINKGMWILFGASMMFIVFEFIII